jgi:cytochrome c peroxidase
MPIISHPAFRLCLALLLPLRAAAAVPSPDPGFTRPANLAALQAQFRRPPEIPFPADNPYTQGAALLGRTLFFDARLSASGSLACANCHNPSFGWEDGLPVGHGAGLRDLGRHTPTILNGAWGDKFFWDGRAASLEAQAAGPMGNPKEMGADLTKLPDRLKSIAGYAPLFDRAFPGQPIGIGTITKALAVFERTLATGPAPFDAWLDGDETAIPASAKRGFVFFAGTGGCAACHSGWAFTDNKFHDIGLPDEDLGRAVIAPAESAAEHAFKTPTLRDVGLRAPYMHNGSLPDLPSVLTHYESGFKTRPSLAPEMRTLVLSADGEADLIAFLRSLSEPARSFPAPTLPQ